MTSNLMAASAAIRACSRILDKLNVVSRLHVIDALRQQAALDLALAREMAAQQHEPAGGVE